MVSVRRVGPLVITASPAAAWRRRSLTASSGLPPRRRATPVAHGPPTSGPCNSGDGTYSRWSHLWRSVLLLHAKQLRRLGAEALQHGVLLVALLHPLHGLGEPVAGLIFLAELPVGHGEEEAFGGIGGIIGRAEADGFFQVGDGPLPVAGTVTGHPEGAPVARISRCQLRHFRRQLHSTGRIAKLGV